MFSSRPTSGCILRNRRRSAPLLVSTIALLVFLIGSAALNAQENRTIRFNGVDAWLDLGSRTTFNFNSSFTLEAWVRPTAFGDTVGIVGNYRRDIIGGSGHALVLDATGHVGLILAHDIGETDLVWSPEPIALDTWTHVAGTWNGRDLRIYIDGVEVADARVSGMGILWTIENSMAVARFIAKDNGYFNGKIDEVRIWSISRNAGELRHTQHLRID